MLTKHMKSLLMGAAFSALIVAGAQAADSTMDTSTTYGNHQDNVMRTNSDARMNQPIPSAYNQTHTGATSVDKSDSMNRTDSTYNYNKDSEMNKTKTEQVSDYIDDAGTTALVKGKILGQSGLDSLDISVETANGVVTLTGEVDNKSQVELAGQVAEEAKGVRNVVNKLTLKR